MLNSRFVSKINLTRPTYISSLIQRRGVYDGKRIESVPEVDVTPKRPRAFDLKAFRTHLRKQKLQEEISERRALMEAYVKPAPEGWTVLTFLQKIKCEGDNLDEIAEKFGTWEKLLTVTPAELYKMEGMTNNQRKVIWRYIKWFNHGLWPRSSADEYMKKFAGKKMEREGLPWSPQEDQLLKDLCKDVDTDFGDAFLIISWRMQRRIDDVRERFVETILKPKNSVRECELVVTKASRPLMMNRKFRLDVPFIYVVPTDETHKLKESSFKIPLNFEKFRIPELFGEKSASSVNKT